MNTHTLLACLLFTLGAIVTLPLSNNALSAQCLTEPQEQILFPSIAQTGDSAGTQVRISANTLIISCPYNDLGGENTGAIVVYERIDSKSSWTETSQILGLTQAGSGYTASIDTNGEWIAVGLGPLDTVNLYSKDALTNEWTLSQTLLPTLDGNQSLERFGHRVRFEDTTLYVGQTDYQTSGCSWVNGAISRFELNLSTQSWEETSPLTLPCINNDGSHQLSNIATSGNNVAAISYDCCSDIYVFPEGGGYHIQSIPSHPTGGVFWPENEKIVVTPSYIFVSSSGNIRQYAYNNTSVTYIGAISIPDDPNEEYNFAANDNVFVGHSSLQNRIFVFTRFPGLQTFSPSLEITPTFDFASQYPAISIENNDLIVGDQSNDFDSTDGGIVYTYKNFFCDCNENGIPDSIDIGESNGTDWFTSDCNGNGIIDFCEVQQDQSLDCDLNAVLDSCEIAQGVQEDCDSNGVLDICQTLIFDTSSPGFSPDCNLNLIPDVCEIASGAVNDCDGNEVPDNCVSTEYISAPQTSGLLTGGQLTTFTFEQIPPAADSVTLRVEAIGDLDALAEYVDVFVNGNYLDSLFANNSDSCGDQPESRSVQISAEAFNTALATGSIQVELLPSSAVDATGCPSTSVTTYVTYFAETTVDCDLNGIPDLCDLLTNAADDCNGNGVPDSCEIAGGMEADSNGNSIPDSCELSEFLRGDPNADGTVDVADAVQILEALFGSAPFGPCQKSFDSNDDASVNIGDAVTLLDLLFNSGTPLPAPSSACGADPSPDSLPCLEFPACP